MGFPVFVQHREFGDPLDIFPPRDSIMNMDIALEVGGRCFGSRCRLDCHEAQPLRWFGVRCGSDVATRIVKKSECGERANDGGYGYQRPGVDGV